MAASSPCQAHGVRASGSSSQSDGSFTVKRLHGHLFPEMSDSWRRSWLVVVWCNRLTSAPSSSSVGERGVVGLVLSR